MKRTGLLMKKGTLPETGEPELDMVVGVSSEWPFAQKSPMTIPKSPLLHPHLSRLRWESILLLPLREAGQEAPAHLPQKPVLRVGGENCPAPAAG